MARRPIKNVPASVHARLLNLARSRGTDLNSLLPRYAAERFLYRLGTSPVSNGFTLKGATLLVVWGGDTFRGTRDVDLLRSGHPELRALRDDLVTIGQEPCPEDGVSFALRPEDIRLGALPVGRTMGAFRAKLTASLGRMRLPLQVDVGFGALPYPDRERCTLPTLLDQPTPNIWTYRRESHIAEKFHAMVQHGTDNSRMKDFWDIAALATRFSFHGPTLQRAVKHTFEIRDASVPHDVVALMDSSFFVDDTRRNMWKGFLAHALLFKDGPSDFSEVGKSIRRFLAPVHSSIYRNKDFPRHWPPGGPWQPIRD